MYKKNSRAKEIWAKLPDVPKNPEEEIKRMTEMNSFTEEFHNDYLYKEAMSEISASKVILT